MFKGSWLTFDYFSSTLFRSLSSKCTLLKHRYDDCFNIWFKGYLQPELDASPPSSAFKIHSNVPDHSILPIEAPAANHAHSTPDADIPPHRSHLVTSWAPAFQPRRPPQGSNTTPLDAQQPPPPTDEVSPTYKTPNPIDTVGKNRAEIKAEEYERACGDSWRSYQSCLTASTAFTPIWSLSKV